jgi:transglutaminase-like putative cysteine protease
MSRPRVASRLCRTERGKIDPTNDLVPGDRHVILAWGRDYDDVSPVKGVTLGGGVHSVKVAVEVRRKSS